MISSFFAPKRALAVASDSTDDGGDGKKRQKMTNPEVEELLSYLQDNQDDNDSQTWYKALEKHTNSASFARLAKFVATERKSQTVFPTPPDTFSALNLTPLKNVKVVIVGQDPYHGPNQGHGLSFSVRKGVKVPPSLKNIYKELSSDPNVDFPSNGSMPNHGYLERWAKQGVLMLNAVLTVRQGSPNSHGKKGWENFTDEVIRVLVNESAKSNKGLVFLLWGKPASSKAQAILGGTSSKRHAVICSSHPSPLGATKTNTPFLGSKCFSRANDALKEFGMEPIDWNVDGEIWSKK